MLLSPRLSYVNIIKFYRFFNAESFFSKNAPIQLKSYDNAYLINGLNGDFNAVLRVYNAFNSLAT